jgi:hypothetical protein
MNQPKHLLDNYLLLRQKKALGRTRGKFGGLVGPPEAERTMDYETLISEGNEEKKAVLERLDASIEIELYCTIRAKCE